MLATVAGLSLASCAQAHAQAPTAPNVASPRDLNVTPLRGSQAVAKSSADNAVVPWSFRHEERPVKVIVLAGSIGAWPRDPYAKRLETICPKIEVKNLSRVGLGALALKNRFRDWVLELPRVRQQSEQYETWLVFGGGLNSVGDPEATNRHIRHIFLLAHQVRIKVLGLTLTPWGDDDERRWQAGSALQTFDNTRKIVAFVDQKATPTEALGAQAASTRPASLGERWHPSELADVSVNLWDSVLRDRQATPRNLQTMRKVLLKDRRWQHRYAKAPAAERQAALERDAQILANIPQWFLHPDLRSFDSIHPNDAGHAQLTQMVCERAPATWGCLCEAQQVAFQRKLPQGRAGTTRRSAP